MLEQGFKGRISSEDENESLLRVKSLAPHTVSLQLSESVESHVKMPASIRTGVLGRSTSPGVGVSPKRKGRDMGLQLVPSSFGVPGEATRTAGGCTTLPTGGAGGVQRESFQSCVPGGALGPWSNRSRFTAGETSTAPAPCRAPAAETAWISQECFNCLRCNQQSTWPKRTWEGAAPGAPRLPQPFCSQEQGPELLHGRALSQTTPSQTTLSRTTLSETTHPSPELLRGGGSSLPAAEVMCTQLSCSPRPRFTRHVWHLAVWHRNVAGQQHPAGPMPAGTGAERVHTGGWWAPASCIHPCPTSGSEGPCEGSDRRNGIRPSATVQPPGRSPAWPRRCRR